MTQMLNKSTKKKLSYSNQISVISIACRLIVYVAHKVQGMQNNFDESAVNKLLLLLTNPLKEGLYWVSISGEI